MSEKLEENINNNSIESSDTSSINESEIALYIWLLDEIIMIILSNLFLILDNYII